MSCPTCAHRKSDGILCGSPALRGKTLCYFHQPDHKRRAYATKVARQLDVLGPRLPRMRSLRQVQKALYEIIVALVDDRIDTRRAGAHLFTLQQTSAALRNLGR